jgi:hypothetical protein
MNAGKQLNGDGHLDIGELGGYGGYIKRVLDQL